MKHLMPWLLAASLTDCGDTALLDVLDGSAPQQPAPVRTAQPTVNIAPAVGWPKDVKPEAAPGTQVSAFARGLDHPRWRYLLPNGGVLVADDVGNVVWRVSKAP